MDKIHLGSVICSYKRRKQGAILFVKVPATIIKSDWRGDALKIIPKRSISYLLTAACIISTAQQARPKVKGHKEPALAHVISDKTREDNHSNFINYIVYLRKQRLICLENPLGLLTPYTDLLFFFPTTGEKSNTPRIAV